MRLEVVAEYKEDDVSSRRSDDLLSMDKSSKSSLTTYELSSVANSTYTGYSGCTFSGSSPSLTPQSGSSSVRSKKRSARKKMVKLMKSNLPALDFDSAGLVGRDVEVERLKSCYDRLMKDGRKELILVGGQSGSGKSSVIRSMESNVSVEGLFVEGKFDMNTSHEPFSGVAKAFGIICRRIKEAGQETMKELREDLQKQLGDKPGMLVQLIPELRDILVVDKPDPTPAASIDRADETAGGVDRLRFAFRVLTKVFSSFLSPLILFLDDLQWADVSSLQVLEYLISDTENGNPLMIIGSYRSEEVDENSLLHNKIVALREKTEKFQFHMTELMIESFNPMDIEKVITAVLPSLRADHVVGLAALCHQRTLGNPYFTIEFLKMLHLEGMLAFDSKTNTWSWDLSEIKTQTMSAANVVVMLEQQLRKLPKQLQALLQCAAYLGSSFSEPTIDLVWSVYGRRIVETKTDPVRTLMPVLVADGIFEKCEKQQYRWAHDKLQEAALSLSETRRETFQLDIGKTLYYGLTKEQVEEDLFTIVDLVNNGNTAAKRQEFASMNLRAAEKAREIAAFQAASEYAAEGISLLKESDWVQNKSVTLNLYTIGAEAELVLGNVEAAEQHREVVLARSDLSAMEMLPLQIGKAKALADFELKSKVALEYCLKLLKKHGCRLTWIRPLALPQAAVKALLAIKKAKAKPQIFYESMEACHDTKQKFIAYLLSKAAYNAYTVGDKAMYLLIVVKLVDITMEFGVNEFSATTFTFLSSLSIFLLQDFDAMERFQNIALAMIKKFRGMHASESIYVGTLMGLLWVRPIESGRAMIEEGMLAGRIEGDLVYTSWCILIHATVLPYLTGRPIQTILEALPRVLAEFEETKLAAHLLSVKTFYQMLLNLSDPTCEKPSEHIGEIYTDTKEDHKGNLLHLSHKLVAEGELVFWHEDYEVGAKRALEVGEAHWKCAPTHTWNQLESFHRAVALYAAGTQTNKGKYTRAANRIRKKLGSLTRYGNTTIQYYHMFLTAENLRFKRNHKEAQLKYEEALGAVGKLGHLHHLGLFNERYSDFLLRDLSLEEESRYRLEQAIGYFREWGAVHKVKALESRL